MLRAPYCRFCIIVELLINDRESAGLCAGTASAACKCVNFSRIYIFFLEHMHNNIISERKLIINMRIFQEFRRIVEKIFLEQQLFIKKETHFRRCRTRIYD